jgi:hypothetical protein
MQTMTEIALGRADCGVFTRQEASSWINADGARLNALLKRAVGSGELLRIIRGLYCLDKRYLRTHINPLNLAQRIQGPSYISLESALSYHGWIPEAVYTITSTSLERSRTFDTPLGVFSYTRVPQSCFYRCVNRIVTEEGGSFLLAEPLKALADYVYAHRCPWDSATPVREALRVEEHALEELDASSFEPLLDQYRSRHMQRFLLGFKKDLGL